MSLYADYLKERQGIETVEHEFGFATYKRIDAETVYLQDIFVVKEHRRNGVASELSAKIAEIAKASGAKKLIGSVDITAHGVTESMKAILGDGFRFSHAQGNGIYFVKML